MGPCKVLGSPTLPVHMWKLASWLMSTPSLMPSHMLPEKCLLLRGAREAGRCPPLYRLDIVYKDRHHYITTNREVSLLRRPPRYPTMTPHIPFGFHSHSVNDE